MFWAEPQYELSVVAAWALQQVFCQILLHRSGFMANAVLGRLLVAVAVVLRTGARTVQEFRGKIC